MRIETRDRSRALMKLLTIRAFTSWIARRRGLWGGRSLRILIAWAWRQNVEAKPPL
jgi:hypothetical protein